MKLNLVGRKMLVIFLMIPIMAMSMINLTNDAPQAKVLDLSAVSGTITMKIDTLKGTSDTSHAKEEHPLISVAFAGFREVAPVSGSSQDRSSSAPTITEIAVLKTVDTASPKIFEEMAKGSNFQDVEISFWTASEKPEKYLSFELENVIITSYVFSGSTGDDVPVESFTLNFEKIQYTYTEIHSDGSKGSSVTGGWDNVKNEVP
jgi:type VI secretion system secreted protein Hcp